MNKQPVLIATAKSWNLKEYRLWNPPAMFTKHLISAKDQLNSNLLNTLRPRYIFFPHWSWIIPRGIYESFECVVFHMTDVPFGRGGSPLQNLLTRGIYQTKISAIRATGGLDAGPVYLKRPLDLSMASAQQLYEKAAQIVFRMIHQILLKQPKPKPQRGDATFFQRRTPEQSRIPPNLSSHKLYDFIRMLDAEGYPPAFTELGGHRLELRNATIRNGSIRANVVIKSKDG